LFRIRRWVRYETQMKKFRSYDFEF